MKEIKKGINIGPGICFACHRETIINDKGICVQCHTNPHRASAYSYRNHYIPARMMGGIERYIRQGIKPGGFLTALFEGRFMDALAVADDENYNNIQAYVAYLYNEVPRMAYGRAEAVKKWIERGGLEGIAKETKPNGKE